MTPSLHAEIAEQAYFLWLEDGMADGRALQHWLAAEQLVIARAMAPKPAKRKGAPRAAALRPKRRAGAIPLHA